MRARFIPGTHLIRYGEGDWNDSLQPVDPGMRDWMVSSWTVALLFQQLTRYAESASPRGRRGGRWSEPSSRPAMQADFNRYLIRDGTVAGYADLRAGRRACPSSAAPERHAHRSQLFAAADDAQHHRRTVHAGAGARIICRLIREHLLFPDGARLMDRPVAYRGGPQTIFRRAESSSFFGREIGLMYVHAHLRYGEAMAVLGEAEALWEALSLPTRSP